MSAQRRKKMRRKNNLIGKIAVVVIILIVLPIAKFSFVKTHYANNTYIEGVDCSFLTIEKAKTKIEDTFRNKKIILYFIDGKQYEIVYSDFDFEREKDSELEEILAEQNNMFNFSPKYYSLQGAFKINEIKLKDYLQSIPELKIENMAHPQNAFLKIGDNQLITVVAEKNGNYIDFEMAYKLVKEAVFSGKEIVDLSSITEVTPDILATNSSLIEQQTSINAVLQTTINYKFADGSSYTLDKSIMKDWIFQKDDGSYGIDVEGNVLGFIKSLQEKAKEKNTKMKFSASEIGDITVSLQKGVPINIDEEAEVKQILTELGSGRAITRTPIYNKTLLTEDLSTYIELDITRQRLWMYVDGECILDTPCVTGNVKGGHSTPVGVYYLTYKTTNATLRGFNNDGSRYASPVSYWMPFNGGIGFHDASWRNTFGGEIYKTNGSHGCVNLPKWAAKTLYENIDSTIPIIIYCS